MGLTVLNAIRGDLGKSSDDLPRVPGHELVGKVIAAGALVKEPSVGERIVAYFYLTCGHCNECSGGRDSLCQNLSGFIGVHCDGGYAPYAILPAANAIPVRTNIDPIAATVIPDAVATPVHVASRASIAEGDRVVVIGGGGGVGIHMVQVALLHTSRVIGLDVTDEKLAAIEDLGAQAVNSSDFSSTPHLFESKEPSVVIDLIGTQEAASWALESLGPRGRLVVMTTFRSQGVSLDHRSLVFPEIEIIGSRYASKAEVRAAITLVALGKVVPVIGDVAGPESILGIHEALRSNALVGRGALDWSCASVIND